MQPSLLREARREAATRHFSVLKPTAMDLRLAQPESLPFELPDEAWAFLEQQLAGGMIQLGLVGAHAYGFPSPDSDFDFKGIHLAPTDAVLGLGPVEENRDTTSWLGGVEVDFTTHEAAKALHMLLKGNGNVLERLVSPFQLVRGEIPDRLRELGQASIGTHFLKHYRGYLQGKRRELASQGENPSIKTLLYVYRVGLTGLHLLRTGECLLDVEPLSVLYGFPEVPDLIALKTVERATAQAPFDPEPLDRLDVELEAALQQSPLATAAPNAREFDALLNALRRARQAQNSSDA